MPSPFGLYIHIPFCQKKCDYCDFYSITRLDQTDHFVAALLTEIRQRAPEFREEKITTIFLGGGTPSLLSEAQLEKIWEALHQHFNISPAGEFSLESNPGTLTKSKLQFLRELGINRLSMGVQSFQPSELRFLGRIHSREEVLENFRHARSAGFTNINLDLMTAFPGITRNSFSASLQEAIALNPEHISCYTLIFEPGTPFYTRMKHGDLSPLADEEEAEYYELAAEKLGVAGYEQYEVSNFARGQEYICRHNLIYWKHHPYVGLGPSAHSFYGNKRIANQRSLAAYIRLLHIGKQPVDFEEEVSLETQMFEYIFLNLRLRSGLDMEEFRQKFTTDFLGKYQPVIQRLQADELIDTDGRRVWLSSKGWLLADSISAYF